MFAPSRRHIFSLWRRWSSDVCLEAAGRSGSSVNGQTSASEAMEVDAVSPLDPRDIKRLKTSGAPPQEHGFLSSVLDTCTNPEQRRLAMAYRKWLDMVTAPQC